MAQKFQLQTEMREQTGTGVAKKLRRQGIVPGVIYGGGQRTYPVQVQEKEITDLLHSAESENVLVDLVVEGAKEKNKLVLIQAVQHHVLSGAVTHVDFQAVREDEEIRALLPLHLHGEPAGVKMGGLLEHQIHSLEVNCLPKNLPERLDFNVEHLKLGQALHVGDVQFPEGVTPTVGSQVVIALVTETRTAKAEAAGGGGSEAEAAAEAGE
tara:strand:- start:7445 stop:8077 length:633 start_codon:yes stop_codon:yes gene_type:complete